MDHQPLSTERIDLVALKKSLNEKLGTNAPIYWTCFVQFLKAQLSKKEWDQKIKDLGPDIVPLHNKFIASLIFNARLGVKTITTSQYTQNRLSYFGRRRERVVFGPNGMKLKKTPQSALETNIFGEQLRSHFKGYLRTPIEEKISQEISRGGLAEKVSLLTSQELPDQISLEARMKKIAIEAGIKEVEPECVTMMMRSMEYYLKMIVDKCIQVKKGSKNIKKNFITPKPGSSFVKSEMFPGTLHSFLHYSDLLGNSDKEESEEDGSMDIENDTSYVVTPRDLLTTIELCPFLLGDYEKIREKISMMDWDLYR